MRDSEYEIVVAETPALQSAAYRLRYEVFSEELGDHRYADHPKREWRDEDDDSGATTLLVAINAAQEIIGTLRLTLLREHAFIRCQHFQLDVLADILQIPETELKEKILRVDRAVVAAAWRGRQVINRLQKASEHLAMQVNGCVLVGLPGSGNRRSRLTFSRLGWIDYADGGEFRGHECQLVYKCVCEDG